MLVLSSWRHSPCSFQQRSGVLFDLLPGRHYSFFRIERTGFEPEAAPLQASAPKRLLAPRGRPLAGGSRPDWPGSLLQSRQYRLLDPFPAFFRPQAATQPEIFLDVLADLSASRRAKWRR